MQAVITGLKTNWHFMRIVRLLLSVALILQFIQTGDLVVLVGAALFAYQSVFNTGCCGKTYC